jgi:hypothetical protein
MAGFRPRKAAPPGKMALTCLEPKLAVETATGISLVSIVPPCVAKAERVASSLALDAPALQRLRCSRSISSFTLPMMRASPPSTVP